MSKTTEGGIVIGKKNKWTLSYADDMVLIFIDKNNLQKIVYVDRDCEKGLLFMIYINSE